jgi:hypothetical protein
MKSVTLYVPELIPLLPPWTFDSVIDPRGRRGISSGGYIKPPGLS